MKESDSEPGVKFWCTVAIRGKGLTGNMRFKVRDLREEEKRVTRR